MCTLLGPPVLAAVCSAAKHKTEIDREKVKRNDFQWYGISTYTLSPSHSLVAIRRSMVIAAIALETLVSAHRLSPVGRMIGLVDALLSRAPGTARTPAFCVGVVSNANSNTEGSVLASRAPCPA